MCRYSGEGVPLIPESLHIGFRYLVFKREHRFIVKGDLVERLLAEMRGKFRSLFKNKELRTADMERLNIPEGMRSLQLGLLYRESGGLQPIVHYQN